MATAGRLFREGLSEKGAQSRTPGRHSAVLWPEGSGRGHSGRQGPGQDRDQSAYRRN